MIRYLQKILRYFFTFSKAEQYGIVALLTLILAFSVLYFILPFVIQPTPVEDKAFAKEVDAFIEQQQDIRDSIEIEKIQSIGQLSYALAKQKLHPFPFNPNRLPEEKWKALGLNDKQIKTIKNYEAKGGKFYTKEDFGKLYCISEAEYKILAPYIVIKPAYTKGNLEIIDHRPHRIYKYTDLNTADSSRLVNHLHFPPWMASRIIRYRQKLGGFYSKKQLLEVYGMKEKYYKPIEKYLLVDPQKVDKICINTAGFKQVLKHPYFDYKLTKKIFRERDKRGGSFSNLNQVLNIIPGDSLRNKVAHYLYICASDARDN